MLTRAGVVRLFSTVPAVVNNVAKQQFSITLGGDDAVLTYEQRGNNITFISTKVPPVFRGKGVGFKLAKSAFDHAYKNNLHVTCQCYFLARYLEDNQNKYKGIGITFDLEEHE